MTGVADRSAVITAGPADLEVLSQVIAEAFLDLPPSRWLIADPAVRRQVFPGYFRLLVEHVLAAGVVQTTADRAAVALWLRVGAQPPEQPADYPGRLSAATAPWTGRFVAFDAALELHHPVGIPHHYLAVLAVRPDRQGRGIGTVLLNAYHEIIDRAPAQAAYLEAASERTRRVYLHQGYADHGRPIQLPGGPQMFPMWRQPLPGRDGVSGRDPAEP